MFGPGGPTLRELYEQAMSSTERGYDLLAPKFDRTPFRTPAIVIERALEGIATVDDALDLCCGTGAALELLAPRTKRRLVGVDFSRAMLDVARASLEGIASEARLELHRGDVLALDVEGPFDLVTCFGALGHLSEAAMPGLVERVRSVLRPGGRFVFVTGERPAWHARRALVSRAFNAAMHLRNALFDPPFVMFYLRFLRPEAERLLRGKGYSVEARPLGLEGPWGGGVAVVATKI